MRDARTQVGNAGAQLCKLDLNFGILACEPVNLRVQGIEVFINALDRSKQKPSDKAKGACGNKSKNGKG